MIILDYPQTKSKMAFHFSVEKMFREGKVFMWTLTFTKAKQDDQALYCWNHLSKALQKHFPLARGLRVTERHPGEIFFGDIELSHGLHFHLLLNQRVPKSWLEKVGRKWGFGWTWVKKCKLSDALYCGKYLSKEGELKKGYRRWGTIGGFNQIKKSDIEIDSTFHRNFRRIQNRVKITQVTPDLLHSIYLNSEKHGPIENWPSDMIQYGNRSKELITPEMLGFPVKDWGRHESGKLVVDPTLPPLKRARKRLTKTLWEMEKVAKRWKQIGNQRRRQRGLSEAKPTGKKFLEPPGETPVKTRDTALDISDNYLDTFPQKTVGTPIANKRVYVLKPFNYVDPGQH